MDKAAAMHIEPGIMAAVDAPLELLEEMMRGQDQVHIGNINSPKQVVISGTTAAVRDLSQRLKERGYRATFLPVSMAFHSPIMKVIHDELEAFVASMTFHSPQIPVLSNTTMAAYPSDPAEIKRILMAHLESPVHWMNNVQTLWNDLGVRLFVEVGPGNILSNLIADTLTEPTCIQTCLPTVESQTYTTALARLFAHGHLNVQQEPVRTSTTPEPRFQSSECLEPGILKAVPDGTGSTGLDLIEQLISIIMDATGFERDEIRPEMDLRRDLSIRSSRLPIIMDAAERQFGITIDLEDFI
jgi:acyl transferase domain-containing protein/acyl carrier protein